jgi:hypothetical protein
MDRPARGAGLSRLQKTVLMWIKEPRGRNALRYQ